MSLTVLSILQYSHTTFRFNKNACMYVGLEATLDASSRPFELTSVDTAQFCLCKKPNKHDKLDFRAFVLKHKILAGLLLLAKIVAASQHKR